MHGGAFSGFGPSRSCRRRRGSARSVVAGRRALAMRFDRPRLNAEYAKQFAQLFFAP
jgi:hypothetical protein